MTDNVDILVFGAATGLGLQMFGILVLLRIINYKGLRSSRSTPTFELFFSIIEYIGSLIEIAIMISVVVLVRGHTVFVVLSMLVLCAPAFFICFMCCVTSFGVLAIFIK